MADGSSAFPEQGEVAALMRSIDWSRSSLGPPDTWSPSLRTVLRLMLTSRYAMWLGWGPELLFFYNDAYREQTLGSKHPSALGRPFREVWSEIWDDLRPRIEHVLTTGEATWDSGLLLFLERNGYSEETYHTFSYSPAPSDTGGVAGLFCVVIEDTERVIAERRANILRELATALGPTKTTAGVLAAIEDCLAKESRDLPFSLTYLFDDRGTEARLAASSGIAADHPGAPAVVDLEDAHSLWPLRRIFQGASGIDRSLQGEWPTGAWKKSPSHAWVVPIAQAGQARPAGAFVAAISPHRAFDATYRSFIELFVGQVAAALANARAYESEKKQAEALAQIDRAKTAFFSNVSHEFRTPLTLMLGPTEDALASPDRALRGDDLEIVHRNELRLLKLVNALLDFSRMEAGRVQAAYVPTDLAELTADLASAFRSAMERGGLRYQVECEPLPEPVYVDRDMWEKIVLNLLSNALKFTLEGEVRVSLRRRGDHVELTVRDTGPGVAPEELPRMFERFHRVEGTRARTHEGSGIGLALVHDLVKLHGGAVRIESELGRGTAFVVSIPMGSAHLPAEQLQKPRSAARNDTRATSYLSEALRWVPDTVAPSNEPVEKRSEGRVLVADDNADMREYVVRLLQERWEVEAVSDGEAALEAIARETPDLVLSDVMMPKLDGFGLVRALRESPATRTIPVILLSARAGEEATGEGLRAGANDYLIKPFAARELIARVASQLAIARIRRQTEAEKEAQRRVVESLFNSAPASIVMLRGDDHVIEFANPLALDIWNQTDDVVGKPLFEVMPQMRGQGFEDLLRSVLRSGEPYVGDELPLTLVRGGHEQIAYRKFVYVPARNAEGVIDRVASFGFDVTRQVEARQRAVLAAAVGRAFVSNDPLATQLRHCCDALLEFGVAARIWTYDSGQRVIDLQASAGIALPDIGRRLRVGESIIGRIAESGAPQIEDPIVPANHLVDVAREGFASFAGLPLRVGDRLVGVMAIFSKRSMTESVLETLATLADQIALGVERDNSERFRELFIGMLGHDLRNPLNAVSVGAHMLANDRSLGDRERKKVDRIRNSAARMNRMIGQVLDFTRARSGGGIPIERTPCDVHAICAQVVDELTSANPQRVIDVAYSGDGKGLWDADRLAQVFSNLIGNALTHGDEKAAVLIEVEGLERSVRCSVHNMGKPIPAAMIPTLFDPFRRATQGKSAGTQGLGLGLFIAHRIVSAHGGSLGVQSTEGEGTTFQFELPRSQVQGVTS